MAKKYSRRALSTLFLKQIRTLEARGVNRNIIYYFQNQREAVLQKAESLDFEEGETPFLPVIPFTYRSYFDQMPMIEIDDKKGTNENCSDCLIWTDTPYLHRKPWYIFKISIGDMLKGKSIHNYCNILDEKGRNLLLPEEVISLALHLQPKNMSLYCFVPHSNSWSQTHLVTGDIPEAGFEGGIPGRSAPTMYGLFGDMSSPRNFLRIPSCIVL